jgi:hypothetical protein
MQPIGDTPGSRHHLVTKADRRAGVIDRRSFSLVGLHARHRRHACLGVDKQVTLHVGTCCVRCRTDAVLACAQYPEVEAFALCAAFA